MQSKDNNHKMLKHFIATYQKAMPKSHHNWIEDLTIHPKMFINYPVQAYQPTPSGISLKALQSIPKGCNIIMLSASESLTNREFVGASQRQVHEIKKAFEKAKEDYEMFESEEIQSLFRIILQVYANSMEIDGGQMPLYKFSNCLLSQRNLSAFKLEDYSSSINSPHLLNILRANDQMVKRLYGMLTNFVKTSNEEEFSKVLKIIRSQIRKLSHHPEEKQDFIDFISPVLPSILLSYSPNCRIEGKYLSHLRQSYYCLETVRKIEQGEDLTLPYRHGLNNYDKFVRYGAQSICESNPHNNYLLIANLQSEPQILEGDISKKTTLLKRKKLKMKNVVRIGWDGNIIQEDLAMLRILMEAEGSEKDGEINKMLEKYATQNLNFLSQNKAKENKKGEDEVLRGIRIIQKEQIQILNRFLMKNK